MDLANVHKAIYTQLERHLQNTGVTIWDYLPRTPKPPLIVLGKMSFNYRDDLSSADSRGMEINQKIHIITKTQEKIQALQILQAVEDALNKELQVTGFNLIKQELIGGFVEETEDELYYIETDLILWLAKEEI